MPYKQKLNWIELCSTSTHWGAASGGQIDVRAVPHLIKGVNKVVSGVIFQNQRIKSFMSSLWISLFYQECYSRTHYPLPPGPRLLASVSVTTSSVPCWVCTHKVTEALHPEKSRGPRPGRGRAQSYHTIRHIHQLCWAENWNGNVGLERPWLPFTSGPELMICHFFQGHKHYCPRSHTPNAAERPAALPASTLLPASR